MSSPDSPKPKEPKSIILVGSPGSGKTTLAMQFPAPCFLDCDRGLDGSDRFLRTKLKDLSYGYYQVTLDEKGQPFPLEKLWDTFIERIKEVRKEESVQTIVIDSITLIDQFLVEYIKKKQGRDKMELQDWGMLAGYYAHFFIALRSLGKTVILTCHEEPVEKADPRNPTLKILDRIDFNVSGSKTKHNMGAYFTDVWRCSSEAAPGGGVEFRLEAIKTSKMAYLKNSIGLNETLVAKPGELMWAKLQPYMKL